MSQSTRIIKRRIKSSRNISQITKAMEMVSAAKMRRAQALALNSRPYTERMYRVITALAKKARNQTEHWLFKDPRLSWNNRDEFTVLIILFSTDKSLCGGLNTNLFRGLEVWLNNLGAEFKLPAKTRLTFVTVGRKAKEHVLKTGRVLSAEFSTMGDRPRFSDILPISHLVGHGFQLGEFQMAFIAFMEFISTISQKLSVRQLLPITAPELPVEPLAGLEAEYIFEPNAEDIFSTLLPQYAELQLYHTLLESLASEHSARMVAMKNAHDNAVEVVDQLTLEFNQARQGRITSELLDVISSRRALE